MVQLTLKNISKYLTEDVVDKAFKSKTKSDDQVKSIQVTRAAPVGEGLISAVYRIQAIGNKYETSFIAKGLLQDILLRKSINGIVYFKREALFYTKILPLLSEFQKATGAKERIQEVIPKFYGCHLDSNNDYILLEDIGESNCASMQSSSTIHERDMTLKTLAHIHAVSLALRAKKPDEFRKIAHDLNPIYYSENNRDWYSKYYQKAIKVYRNVIEEVEDPKSIYYKKFNDLVNNDPYGQLIDMVSTWGQHPVFNHGDAWFPNFLLCDDKAVAIDFQFYMCASPAIDLSTIIILCSHLCRVKDDFFEATQVYYKFIEYYLRDMGIDGKKVFSFENLQDQLKKYGKYGILAALSSFPLLASERCDAMKSLELKELSLEKIPLEDLWILRPIKDEDQKACFINALHVAVDYGLI